MILFLYYFADVVDIEVVNRRMFYIQLEPAGLRVCFVDRRIDHIQIRN